MSPKGNRRPGAEVQPRELPVPKTTFRERIREFVANLDNIREHRRSVEEGLAWVKIPLRVLGGEGENPVVQALEAPFR